VKQTRPLLLVSGLLLLATPTLPLQAQDALPADPQWAALAAKDGTTLPAQAQALEAAGQFRKAAKLYAQLFAEARSPQALAWSLNRKAECLFKAGKWFQAQDAYRQLLDSYSPYLPLQPVLANLRVLAAKMASGEASALNFKNVGVAETIYRRIVAVAPAGPDAPTDLFTLAGHQADQEKGGEAVETYRKIVRQFPRSATAPKAGAAAGQLLLREARQGDGDGLYHRQARFEFERVLRDYPDADPALLAQARAALAEIKANQATRLLELGRFYTRKLSYRPDTARRYFYDVTRLFPESAQAGEAERLLATIEGGAVPAGAPGAGAVAPPELPPQPVTRLQPTPERLEKYLLPVEDYSDYLPGRRTPEPVPAPATP